jgi:hypothetical protein
MPSVPNTNIYDPSEKRLSFVYNSEISGFQPLDFGKLNNVEDVLINFSGNGINVHQDDLNPAVDAVSVSGQLYNIISGFNSFGINVHQDDLNPAVDAVSVSGELYNIISGFNSFGINVHQDDLTAATDFVTAVPQRSSTISNFTPSTANGTVLQANANRKELFIQNISTSNHLHLKYGASAASDSFNFILGSASSAAAANGGNRNDFNYTGIVSVSGTSPNYIAWERT